jgi:hypothetical protein
MIDNLQTQKIFMTNANRTKIYGDKIQGDQKVSMHVMITVQKHAKIFLNSFKHLPW